MGQPGSHTLLENRKLYPKIQNSEFEKFLRKNYLNNLNFCAKNHDFNQKHNYQKMKINSILTIFGTKIQNNNFAIFNLKLKFWT